MQYPLRVLTLIFCLGIAFAKLINISFGVLYFIFGIFFLGAILFFRARVVFYTCIYLSIFFLGATLFKSSFNLPACHISKYIFYGGTAASVKGYIQTEPEFSNGLTKFTLNTEQIQTDTFSRACCGSIWVQLRTKKDLSYGDELILKGRLRKPFSRSKNYFYAQGIYAVMSVPPENALVNLGKNKGSPLKRFSLSLKNKIEKIIFRNVSSLAASILDAMVLGEKANIPPAINDYMVKSGTVHILVVSGFNVGIVAFIIILLLKLFRLPRKARFYLALPCLVIYCLMTGASTPVVRATIMAIIFMSGRLLKREVDIYNSLSLAALAILMVSPQQLFDVGFQLSFISVFAIVYFYPKIKAFLRIGNLKPKFIKFFLEGFLVSFSAWLGTVGFIAYYFKIFSPITVIANIFIVPLATLVTLCGFSLILASLIFPLLARFFASTTELIVALLLNINFFLVHLPGAYLYLP